MATSEDGMYQPPHFREDRLEVQHELIRRHPLGALVTVGPEGLVANHVPFLVDAAASPLGTLRAHLSRANDQWRHADGVSSLVIFQGVERYITPAWYAAKREHGRVVPTWDYVLVHVRGTVRVIEDRDWLHAHVSTLVDTHETGRPEPWAVSDAPDAFIDGQLKGIVGIEIEIGHIEGKWKVSQNRSQADIQGVVDGLRSADDADAAAMAGLVAAHLEARSGG